MRLSVILLAVPLLGAAPPEQARLATTPVPDVATRDCQLLGMATSRKRAEAKKLGELPPADAFAGVWRVDERGCPIPLRHVDR